MKIAGKPYANFVVKQSKTPTSFNKIKLDQSVILDVKKQKRRIQQFNELIQEIHALIKDTEIESSKEALTNLNRFQAKINHISKTFPSLPKSTIKYLHDLNQEQYRQCTTGISNSLTDLYASTSQIKPTYNQDRNYIPEIDTLRDTYFPESQPNPIKVFLESKYLSPYYNGLYGQIDYTVKTWQETLRSSQLELKNKYSPEIKSLKKKVKDAYSLYSKQIQNLESLNNDPFQISIRQSQLKHKNSTILKQIKNTVFLQQKILQKKAGFTKNDLLVFDKQFPKTLQALENQIEQHSKAMAESLNCYTNQSNNLSLDNSVLPRDSEGLKQYFTNYYTEKIQELINNADKTVDAEYLQRELKTACKLLPTTKKTIDKWFNNNMGQQCLRLENLMENLPKIGDVNINKEYWNLSQYNQTELKDVSHKLIAYKELFDELLASPNNNELVQKLGKQIIEVNRIMGSYIDQPVDITTKQSLTIKAVQTALAELQSVVYDHSKQTLSQLQPHVDTLDAHAKRISELPNQIAIKDNNDKVKLIKPIILTDEHGVVSLAIRSLDESKNSQIYAIFTIFGEKIIKNKDLYGQFHSISTSDLK